MAHVREKFALHAARLLGLMLGVFELIGLHPQTVHEIPRQPDGAQPSRRAQPFRRPRAHRDVDAGAPEQQELEDFRGPDDWPVFDECQFEKQERVARSTEKWANSSARRKLVCA